MVAHGRLRILIGVAVAGCLAAPTAEATYPGRNGRIAVVSSACPTLNVFCTDTIRPDGSDRRRLGALVGASWSASGRLVLGVASTELVLADQRGRVLRTIPRPTGPDGEPLGRGQAALAPDGGAIAFVSYVDLHTQPEQLVPWIWTMATDGTGLRQLRPGSRPRWTPDGQRIVFERYSSYGSYRGIASMPADGRRVRLLLGARARLLDLAPDGRRLLSWGLHRVGDRRRSVVGIFTSDSNGGNSHLISRSHPSGAGAWSPDGKKVVFVADDPDMRGVFTASADGSGRPHRVLRKPYQDVSWQPRPR